MRRPRLRRVSTEGRISDHGSQIKRAGETSARWPPVAIGVCILALECSQILYNAVTRPDLAGDVARVLIAHAHTGAVRTTAA